MTNKRASKIILIIVSALLITCSFLFVKPKKAKAEGCATEVVTNIDTGIQYCMPYAIYNGTDVKKAKYRAMVRRGTINQNDIDILTDLAKYENISNQMLKDGITSENWLQYLENNQNRLDTYIKGIFTGQTLRQSLAFFNYQIGQAFGAGNPDLWQRELESIQNSGYKNYYNSSNGGNVYNTGDTNYYQTFNPVTNQFYYNNTYYTVNNYEYNINNSIVTYNLDNSNTNYFNVTYNIDNTSINLVQGGQSTSSTYYFQLPDGRNSYNLTDDQIYGFKTDLHISNYAINSNNADLLGLFHLDGNKNNSALHNVSQQTNNGGKAIYSLSYVGLPSQYQQVEYISANGNQYIDTLLNDNFDGYRVNISFRVYGESNGGLFIASGPSPDYYQDGIRHSATGVTTYLGYESSNNLKSYAFALDRSKNYIIDYSLFNGVSKYYLNGKNLYNGTYNECGKLNKSFYIFADNYNGARFYSSSTLYYLKFYNSVNNLVAFFVPCYRKADNVIGLYDTVRGQFFTNSGTGTFAKGSNIQAPTNLDLQDYNFNLTPNSITYLNDNNNFNDYLYLGNGSRVLNFDLTDNGQEIDFRFYPVASEQFNMSLGDVDISMYKGEVVTDQYTTSESTTQTYAYVSYTKTVGKSVTVTATGDVIANPPSSGYPVVSATCGNTGGGQLVEYSTNNGSRLTAIHRTSSMNYTAAVYELTNTATWTCRYPNLTTSTTTQTIPTTEYFWVKNNLAEYINFGEWNHIAIQKNGQLYINGKYIDTYNSLFNGNILTINLDSKMYSYIDEVRITKSNKYSSTNLVNGLSFNPPSLPYDTNLVYTLPENALSGQLLIQSIYPVNNWQVGGVRPSNVTKGDVYINITDVGLMNSLQQYDGTDWIDVKGAIYDESLGLWVSYYGYSIYTSNWDYNDLTEMNPNDIKSDLDFYSWLGAWFTKMTKGIDNLKLNISNSISHFSKPCTKP